MPKSNYLAFDLGAESGRAILGTLHDDNLTIKELHRFPNGMTNILGHFHWNVFRLFDEMKRGLLICEDRPDSISVDTWGVDFALLAEDGGFLGLPFAYRDSRTDGVMEEFWKSMPAKRVYELTGIQMLPFNSIYQLFAMSRVQSPVLQAARDILFIPDVFNYLLTGQKKTEFTFATTSQIYNPSKADWDDEILEMLGIPKTRLQEIVQPGTMIGKLHQTVTEETGVAPVPVIACASHDTGSAVAAVPARGKEWAYLSSGTWSLLGVEATEPVLSEQAFHFNITNEGGVAGTFRLLKNVMGLWIVQQCKKSWDKTHVITYEELTRRAETASPFKHLIDPDDASFLNPADMPEAIRAFCTRTGQAPPATAADMVRSILESLALKYRFVFGQLQQMYPYTIKAIHIIGGGAKNELLCQFTANATGLAVITGPVEATAIGNIMVQALGLGHVESIAKARSIIRNSFPTASYEPRDVQAWEQAYDRFTDMLS